MPNDLSLLAKYDALCERLLLMRLVANGAAHLFDDESSKLYALLRTHGTDQLRLAFDDMGTALLFLRDEFMNLPCWSKSRQDGAASL